MTELQLGAVESRFADIIWQHAPVTSSQLVKLGEAEMGWKRTTDKRYVGRDDLIAPPRMAKWPSVKRCRGRCPIAPPVEATGTPNALRPR